MLEVSVLFLTLLVPMLSFSIYEKHFQNLLPEAQHAGGVYSWPVSCSVAGFYGKHRTITQVLPSSGYMLVS